MTLLVNVTGVATCWCVCMQTVVVVSVELASIEALGYGISFLLIS